MTRVEAFELFFLPLPLTPTEIGEGNVYFEDARGETYFIRFGEVLTFELDLVRALSVSGGK